MYNCFTVTYYEIKKKKGSPEWLRNFTQKGRNYSNGFFRCIRKGLNIISIVLVLCAHASNLQWRFRLQPPMNFLTLLRKRDVAQFTIMFFKLVPGLKDEGSAWQHLENPSMKKNRAVHLLLFISNYAREYY